LTNFDLRLSRHGIGTAFHPVDGFLFRFALPDPVAGNEFLRLGERAIDDGALLPENLTRAPLELGWSPSPASITPAFTNSSLNLPISVNSCAFGMTPASDSFVAFTMTMNRISTSYAVLFVGLVDAFVYL